MYPFPLERVIELEHDSLMLLEQYIFHRVWWDKSVGGVKKDSVRVGEHVWKGITLEHDRIQASGFRNSSIPPLQLRHHDRAIVVFRHPAFFEPTGNSRIDIQPGGEVLMSEDLYRILVTQLQITSRCFAFIALDTLQNPCG